MFFLHHSPNLWGQMLVIHVFPFQKNSSHIWNCSSFYVLLCIPPTARSKIATCAQTIHMAPAKSAPGLWEVQLRIGLRSDFLHHFWRGAKLSKGNYASVCSSKVCVHTGIGRKVCTVLLKQLLPTFPCVNSTTAGRSNIGTVQCAFIVRNGCFRPLFSF